MKEVTGHLSIGDAETTVKTLAIDICMPIGAERLATFQFQHSPVHPIEMERAIEIVEDIIMPQRQRLGELAALATDNDFVRQFPALTSVRAPEKNTVTVEQVEDVFNQLADIVSGSPVTGKSPPYDIAFTSTLLIVRELLHHWNIRVIRLINKEA